MLGCGINHSVVISEGVYVWGRSGCNELGVKELLGFSYPEPFKFPLRSVNTTYLAVQVATGDAHTAIVAKETSLGPLKLVYSDKFDVSSVFSVVLSQLKPKKLSSIHETDWDCKEYITKDQITEFFGRFQIFNEDYTKEQVIEEIVNLLMQKTNKPGKLKYKEFRDQLYGNRLDEGIVLTWGATENGRLGRGNQTLAEEGFELKDRIVSFQEEISVSKVACGGAHTLAISNGKLYAWGANAYGQLGTGDSEDRFYPSEVRIQADFVEEVAGGGFHSLALDNENQVYSWGLGDGGRLGYGSNLELEPKVIPGLRNVESISAGHSHSGCISVGKVYTWGIGTYGRLGHGELKNETEPREVEFFEGKYMLKLSLSFFHSGVLGMNGEVWSWGNSKNGRLGVPVSGGQPLLVPSRVGIGTQMASLKIVDFCLGYKHGLALAKTGQIFAWGCSADGKLGFKTKSTEENIPKEVRFKAPRVNLSKEKFKLEMPLSSTAITSVSCSEFNTYCLTDSGELLCWGTNEKGQLGNSVTDLQEDYEFQELKPASGFRGVNSYVPLLLDTLKHEKIATLSSSGESCIALTTSGKVYAWGNNQQGQLGLGLNSESSYLATPQTIGVFKRVEIKSVACGPEHSAFIAKNGEVYTCGNADNGKLGLGDSVLSTLSNVQLIPRAVLGIPNIRKISCGVDHTVAVDYFSKVWVWGSNWKGKLGVPETTDLLSPVCLDSKAFYPKLTCKLKNVACGEHHTLLLNSQGDVYCAGYAKYAGIQAKGEIHNFQRIPSLSSIKWVSAGREHSLAVNSRGQLYGWGKNTHSKLGPGPFQHNSDPEFVLPSQIILNIEKVFYRATCGTKHSVALSKDGCVFVWGDTSSGRLGVKEVTQGELPKPTLVSSIVSWLKNKQKVKQTRQKSEMRGEYFLQSLLNNEPLENTEEVLLSQDRQLLQTFEELLEEFGQVKEIENERLSILSNIESVCVSQIQQIPSVAYPKFKLTLPPFISKNIQLYEYLMGCLQSHPCYLACVIKNNPSLTASQVTLTLTATFGSMTNNPWLIRKFMMFYKLILKHCIQKTDFKRSLKVKAGDLPSLLYFHLLHSQPCNTKLINQLSTEIMKILYTTVKEAQSHLEKEMQHIPSYAYVDKVQEALNFRNLEEQYDSLGEELVTRLQERKILFGVVVQKVLRKIRAVLYQDPKVSNVFDNRKKLSDEIKFMFKDIPVLFKERFLSESITEAGIKILNSKIVSLFFLPIIEILKEPRQVKKVAISEFETSFKKCNCSFEEFVRDHEKNLGVIASYLENVSERNLVGSSPAETEELQSTNDSYLKELADALTHVSDLNLADLVLGDMLRQSLQPEDPNLTISVEDVTSVHALLYANKHFIAGEFTEDDPVYLILETLGDISVLFDKVRQGNTRTVKVNLSLPVRWLLSEKAVQSCVDCKMPLTYSLLKKKPSEEFREIPTSISTLWQCFECGNTQNGWHMKCKECTSVRRDFPAENIFQNYKPEHCSTELKMFLELLQNIPEVPPSVKPQEFLLSLVEKDKVSHQVQNTIRKFLKRLLKQGSKNLTKKQRVDEMISLLEFQAKHDYELRVLHKSYQDSIFQMLGQIRDEIKLEILKFNQNTKDKLLKALENSASFEYLKNPTKKDSVQTNSCKAQGRFTVEYLLAEGILIDYNLPKVVAKKTICYFSETSTGSFEVRIVLKDTKTTRCLSSKNLELKLVGFEITPEKLKAMRRTMNSRAHTSFADGRVTFDVFGLVRMLGSLLGNSKKST